MNLAPIIITGIPAIAEHLVCKVACSEMNVAQISRDLESEGVVWSNKKI